MENFLSRFRLAQCYVTINSVKQEWQHFPQLGLRAEKAATPKKTSAVVLKTREQTSFRAYNVRSRVLLSVF